MNITILFTIIVLGILSLTQRLIPWLLLRRQSKVENLDRLFEYFSIAAFSSLMVEELPSHLTTDLIALFVALLVSIRTKNVGLTVLSAMAVALLSGFLLNGIAL